MRALRIVCPPGILARRVDGVMVVLDTTQGRYYRLNGTAARIWEQVLEEGDVDPAARRLAAEAGAEAERVADDVLSLVGRLIDLGLFSAC